MKLIDPVLRKRGKDRKRERKKEITGYSHHFFANLRGTMKAFNELALDCIVVLEGSIVSRMSEYDATIQPVYEWLELEPRVSCIQCPSLPPIVCPISTPTACSAVRSMQHIPSYHTYRPTRCRFPLFLQCVCFFFFLCLFSRQIFFVSIFCTNLNFDFNEKTKGLCECVCAMPFYENVNQNSIQFYIYIYICMYE